MHFSIPIEKSRRGSFGGNLQNNTLTNILIFRHINVLLLIGCVSRRDILTIVTKWCDASTLYKYIHDEKSNFELLKMIKIVRQTSQGME